jgi:hypothetical protein
MAAKSDFLGTWLQGFCPQESRRDRLILPQQHVFLLFSLQLPVPPPLYLYIHFPLDSPLILSVSLLSSHLSCFCNFIDLTLRIEPPLVCHLSIFALSFSTHRLKIALLHPDVCQMLTPYQAFIFFIRFSIYILRCFFNFLKAFVFLIAPARHIPVGINTSTTNPSSLCSPRGPCAPHLLQS